MHSPSKADRLIVQEDNLEAGGHERDGLPQEIWDDIVKRENFLYYALIFLNGSVMWAYYSCLSAQNFHQAVFSRSGLDFSFLTTLVTSWSMFVGQSIQMALGLDKKVSQQTRVFVGYDTYLAMAILIMVFSAINFAGQKTGATLILVCFAFIGAANSLAEATYYALAALFPVEEFTNAVQVGNVWVGILNITIQTLLRLAIDGTKQTGDSIDTSFYLFFSLLVVVLLAAVVLYRRVVEFLYVRYLIERNEASTRAEGLNVQSIGDMLSNITRIFKIIWLPAVTQLLVLFVSLVTIPGFGCAAARSVAAPVYSDTTYPMAALWYCSPGIIGSYDLGDFIDWVFCGVLAYKIFTTKRSFVLSLVRFAFILPLLMGVAGTSLYSSGRGDLGVFVYNAVLNFVIGVSNSLLCTVTMGVAPRLLKPEDQETGGALMVWWLFLGITGGSTLGFIISDQHWFGL